MRLCKVFRQRGIAQWDRSVRILPGGFISEGNAMDRSTRNLKCMTNLFPKGYLERKWAKQKNYCHYLFIMDPVRGCLWMFDPSRRR